MEEARRGSLQVCYGEHHTTLFDEFERLTFEIQLNRTILRRSYSAPSPARFAAPLYPPPVQQRIPAPCREPRRGSSRLAAALRRWFRFGPVFGQRTRSKRKEGGKINRPKNLGRHAY